MHIYPGNAVGLGSAQKELEVARNTVHIHSLVENKLGELEYKKALEKASDEKKETAVKHAHFYKAGAFNASNLCIP